MKHSRQSTTWTDQPAWAAALRGTALFSGAVEATHTRALRLAAQTITGVERTRATFLSYSKQAKADFTAGLRALLGPQLPHQPGPGNIPRHGAAAS